MIHFIAWGITAGRPSDGGYGSPPEQKRNHGDSPGCTAPSPLISSRSFVPDMLLRLSRHSEVASPSHAFGAATPSAAPHPPSRTSLPSAMPGPRSRPASARCCVQSAASRGRLPAASRTPGPVSSAARKPHRSLGGETCTSKIPATAAGTTSNPALLPSSSCPWSCRPAGPW